MPLEVQGFSFTHAVPAVAAVPIDFIVVPPVLIPSGAAVHPEAPVSEHSPPDLNLLHSTFLI